MPSVFWDFHLSGKSGVENDRSLEPHSRGIYTASAEDVEALATASGFEADGWDRDGVKYRKIDVKELEDSERLVSLLAAIKGKYGFIPSSTKIVPVAKRDHVFGLAKYREYTEGEINAAELLHISHVEKDIGTHSQGTEEDVDAERFIVEKRKKKKTVKLGTLTPFLAIAVTGELKTELLESHLVGLNFEPVVNGDDIWKLTSAIMMPRCLLHLVDGQGEVVEADEWPGKWSDKYFDDAGYEPPELRYQKSEISQLGDFDIAITAERTGGYKKTSFRRLVVSQKFRTTLDDLGVKGVRYTPVRIEDKIESHP